MYASYVLPLSEENKGKLLLFGAVFIERVSLVTILFRETENPGSIPWLPHLC